MATKTKTKTKMDFQAEVKQVLDLVIHSLYSNKEIFVRELISNASDALDKARLETLKEISLLGDDKNFKIKIELDTKNKVFTIHDNGIGMSKEELIENIGTIAKSGTKEFLKKLKDNKDKPELIGQFGVGFYSIFMVADKVILTTKRLGSKKSAIQWTSKGEASYTLEEVEKDSRGTSIQLFLKKEEEDFSQFFNVQNIIKKYNSYIPHPIYMDEEKEVGEGDNKKTEVFETIINDKPPIWRRPKAEVKKPEYHEFYKHISQDQEEPLFHLHNKVEGTLEYSSLLFVPSKAPFDLFQPEKTNGLSLYVKRVFIMNDCKELLPNYLRFVKGIIDSEDLPLNVSREILQKNESLIKIQKASTKKILSELQKIAIKKPDEYQKFWKEFGVVLKEGFHMNWETLDELKKLVRFPSSKGSSKDIRSLENYISDMPKAQKEIYYISGENYDAVHNSPHLEVFNSKNIEVLYMVDPIDEWVVQSLTEFDGKKVVNVTKGNLNLDEDTASKEKQEVSNTKYKDLFAFISKEFEDQVKEVRSTNRLKNSPCCLVSDETDMGQNMERILKMTNQSVTKSKRILEVNPDHPICQNILKQFSKNQKNPIIKDWCHILINQALLAEGSEIINPTDYVQKVNKILETASA